MLFHRNLVIRLNNGTAADSRILAAAQLLEKEKQIWFSMSEVAFQILPTLVKFQCQQWGRGRFEREIGLMLLLGKISSSARQSIMGNTFKAFWIRLTTNTSQSIAKILTCRPK